MGTTAQSQTKRNDTDTATDTGARNGHIQSKCTNLQPTTHNLQPRPLLENSYELCQEPGIQDLFEMGIEDLEGTTPHSQYIKVTSTRS